MLSQFPQETQQEVFGRQPYMLAPAALSPTGTATPVDGGFRLSGRWGWGTGVMHADWVLLGGGMVSESGPPDMRMFLLPRDQVRVELTWDAAGMQGTGSNDIVVADAFVPEHRSEPMLGMTMGRGRGSEWLGSPSYRHPMIPLLCLAAGVPALGAARRAVALFKERLATRSLMVSQTKQLQLPAAQMRLGHASSRVHDAETIMRGVGRTMKHWGDSGELCPFDERARMRLSVAHAVDLCRTAVREVMEASGASAHLKPHPLQRIHRDVHTLSCHTIFDLDAASENYGRMLLGFPPSSLF
jgi:alkylation response protein AidB-like acyl-CoA dehydrogenase